MTRLLFLEPPTLRLQIASENMLLVAVKAHSESDAHISQRCLSRHRLPQPLTNWRHSQAREFFYNLYTGAFLSESWSANQIIVICCENPTPSLIWTLPHLRSLRNQTQPVMQAAFVATGAASRLCSWMPSVEEQDVSAVFLVTRSSHRQQWMINWSLHGLCGHESVTCLEHVGVFLQ